MSKKKKHTQRKKTVRIYLGENPLSEEPLYWRARVKDAKQPVRVNGTVLDALQGVAGATIGCHLSQCALHNANHFPHPCKLPVFTKTTALIVSKITNGQPSEVIRYRHSLGALVDLNDTQLNRKNYLRSDHRKLVEKTFILNPPRKTRPGQCVDRSSKKRFVRNGSRTPKVPRGALARAAKAGLISKGVFNVLTPWDPSKL